MEKRKMGALDLMAFPLAFGTASISGEGGGYGFGNIGEKEAIELLLRAFDLGVNVYDTAPIYGHGLAEKRLGMAFKDKRESVFIISKGGVATDSNKRVNMTNDPIIMGQMLEQSLKTLQIDFIDLYMIHWPDPLVDIRLPMEVLSRAKKAGKIKSIGLSNTTKEDFLKASEVDRVDVLQSEFSLLNSSVQYQLFDLCKEHQMGFMSWGTLSKGILSGTIKNEERTFDTSDARSWAPWWKNTKEKEKRKVLFQIMDDLRLLCDKADISTLALALGYNLSFKELTTAICGVRSIEQLEDVVNVLDKPVPLEIIKEAQDIIKKWT